MKLLKIFIFGLIIIFISKFAYSQGWYSIIIYNSQSSSTPAPFQQDIAICNGSINIGPNFAYVNNPILFNEINSNGSNVYFTTTYNSNPNIYSWYEGQENLNGVTCDVWWVNLSNGIPANSNITISMYIGSNNSNYYQQYYPYVGTNEQVIGTMQYDNGQKVFIAYGYFYNTFDGWSGHIFTGSLSPTATRSGIEMLYGTDEGTYILPPNNGNIPEIPLIVEEAWYYDFGEDANVIALFGDTTTQIYADSIGSSTGPTHGGDTPTADSSTFVQFEYWNFSFPPNSQAAMLKCALNYEYLNYTYFQSDGGTVYSYLIVNSTYAETGYYYYNPPIVANGYYYTSSGIWVPLTLLDTYTYNVYNSTNIHNQISGYTYSNLNYNPFQYGTLEIGAGDGQYGADQFVEWVVARAYPPNGVMPSISIQTAVSSVQVSPSSSSSVCPGTQTSSTVTANLNNPYGLSTTVTFSCSATLGITCSFNSSSCTTNGSSCSTTLYVNSNSYNSLSSGWFQVTITNSQSSSTPAPFQQDIAICNGTLNIGSSFAYINNPTLFNEINSNGSNIYFTTTLKDTPNIYSWYEGQLNYNGVICDVWWINLSNGIPANGNITIYMYVGNSSANYYQQYYPYVGEVPTLSSTYGQYDNGQKVFNYYWNFNGTSAPPGINVYTSDGSVTFNNGVIIKGGTSETGGENGIATNISFSLPIIVEYYGTQSTSPSGDYWAWNVVGFSNGLGSSYVSPPGGSYYVGLDFENGVNAAPFEKQNGNSVGSITDGILSQPAGNLFPLSIWTQEYLTNEYYTYVNYTPSLYTGYITNITNSMALPFEIMVGNNEASYVPNGMTVYWLRVRAYPPNGIMPSFSIQFVAPTPTISVNTSTNFQFNISIFDPYTEYVNYTVYLNGSVLTTNNVSMNAGQTLTIPYTYQYLFNQSGTYNLTVVAYGQTSGVTTVATDIFNIQLDQLNVSMSPVPYVYNGANYTNLYNSNLNINYYCMRPNNTLIIYDNITNQTLQYNLSCNYIETPENLFANLTPILQNNTLNYINGSLTYGTQSFNLSFEPLWDTVTVNLTIYLPQILVYTAPLGLNYTVIVNDVLPNVVCNTSFYDNNNLIQINSPTLTNSSVSYSWDINQTPINNFQWNVYCYDPVNVTTSFTYSTGPYYYNEFNLYMEDSGNIPSNVTYSLTLECANSAVQYSNANDENYTLYLWTNNQCNSVLISQNIQGITFDEAFNTNLLSNYAFQWPICLINTSLTYYDNPLVGSQSYQGTLISVENPQTGCYLTGSYLNLYSSNNYYIPVPMRDGALYSIRINNTFLTTVQGSQQQAISIDQLIVQLRNQVQSYINVTLTGATINLSYTNGYPELIVQTPYNISSIYVQLYNNSNLVQTYNLTSINSNIANIIITNPPGFNFTSNQYAILTISYTNGLQQILYYPPYKAYGTIPLVISWIVMLALLYEWFSAFQHYWKIIISLFVIVGALIIATFFNVATTPLLFLSGFITIYLYDFAIKYFVEQSMGDQPLFKFASVFLKIILVMMFVSTLLASFNVPGMSSAFTNVQAEINVAQNIQGALNTMASNPLSFPVEIVLLAGYLIYGMFTSASVINALFSMILGYLSPVLGPLANVLSITIGGIIDIAIAVVVIVSLWVILFGLGYFKL